MRLVVVVGILLLCMGSSQAAEDMSSGSYTLRYCKEAQASSVKDSTSPLMVGYCLGVASTLQYMARQLPTELKACLPPDVTTNQVNRAVVGYLEQHQELLSQNLILLGAKALHEAWPCK
jgi:hypothetical protein